MKTTPEVVSNDMWRELRAFVYRRVKDKALAADIVQDALLKVHTKLGQLRDSEKLTEWVFQITRNAITDHFRTRSKPVNLLDLDWESDTQPLNDCVASCLGEMLATLPVKYRQALELAEIESLSQTEMAVKLNISYSGAKSRVQRARQMLKEKMDHAYLIKTDAYGNVIVCENRVPCNCGIRDAR